MDPGTPEAPPPGPAPGADDVPRQGVAPIDWSVSDPLHPPASKIESLMDAHLSLLGRAFSSDEEGLLRHAIWGTYQHCGQSGVTPSAEALRGFLMSWIKYERRNERVGAPGCDIAALGKLYLEFFAPIEPRRSFQDRRTLRRLVVVVAAEGLVYTYDSREPDRQVVIPVQEFPDRVYFETSVKPDLPDPSYQHSLWERMEFEVLRRLKTAALEEVYERERAREPSLAALARTLASRRAESPGPRGVADGVDEPVRESDGESAPDDAVLIPVEEGDVVSGQVVGIDQEEVLVDIGFDCVGVIPSTELSIRAFVDAADEVSLGEEVYARVLIKKDREGRPVLSMKRARFEKAWRRLEAAAESGEPVQGTVVAADRRGSLTIDVGVLAHDHSLVNFGVSPPEYDRSTVSIHGVQHPEELLGRRLEFRVVSLIPDRPVLEAVVVADVKRQRVADVKRQREAARDRQRRRDMERAKRQGGDEGQHPMPREVRTTGEREQHELACRRLRDAVDDAAETLCPAAVQSLLDSYGRDWLSEVNARREREGLTRFKDEEVVKRDARAALSVIGYDPMLEPDFGAAVGKARFVLGVTNATHHPSDLPDDAKLADAHRRLNELCEVARREARRLRPQQPVGE